MLGLTGGSRFQVCCPEMFFSQAPGCSAQTQRSPIMLKHCYCVSHTVAMAVGVGHGMVSIHLRV